MQPAPVVLVVSLPKTGTHLIGELMKRFGYEVYGPSGPGGFGEPMPPQMQEDLGRALASVPSNTCIVIHQLPLAQVQDQLAALWQQTGVPAVIFNYRDPRDVYCSWVRYLMKDSYSKDFEPLATQIIQSEILHSIEDPDDRLMHAITDPSFPGYVSFEHATWLLKHPRVLNVSFESLVGSAGGGDDRVQVKKIAEIMRHLNLVGDPHRYTDKIYRQDTYTFSRGQIGAWKDEFKPEHMRAFNTRFGDLLETYGYRRVAA